MFEIFHNEKVDSRSNSETLCSWYILNIIFAFSFSVPKPVDSFLVT